MIIEISDLIYDIIEFNPNIKNNFNAINNILDFEIG